MGSFSFLSQLITTINWFNSSKKRRKIKRSMKLVDVMDNKLLLFHPLIFLWKTHQTFSALETFKKKKKMLLFQSHQRVDQKTEASCQNTTEKFKQESFAFAKTLTLSLSTKMYCKMGPVTK